METFFKLKDHQTSVKTELMAGLTTFMTMAYILVVNPMFLSKAGMDAGAVFTATALSAAFATTVMALTAKLPFALAPGMGLNAFFAFTVVLGMGYSWQFALTAVFLEGLIFIALSLLNIREAIINAIPENLKKAVSSGVGLFICMIGLVNAGVIKTGMAHVGDGRLDGVVVTLGDVTGAAPLVAFIGLAFSAFCLVRGIKGALLWGIFLATAVGIPMGVTQVGDGFSPVSLPPSIAPVAFQLDFSQVFSADMAIVLFTFLFVDLFDTVGTLVGVTNKSGMVDKDGRIPRAKAALFSDAIGTTAGALLGTSTVTTYVESASGVSEGGRTGLTALAVAGLFLLALFLAPIFTLVPAAATAPALVLVGLFMMSPIQSLDLEDYTEALPAFLTVVMMPFTYSIANGIIFGFLSYIVLKMISGKATEVKPLMYAIGVLFLAKFMLLS
ncbi:NCS2 family permease [Pseudobacteriovorax antillogorgiicola]|uniref:Putative MFS transporter, AGZA family, xanthine/uracil permease n=1 Tax=Pseudobacteriovorax antillogorgiicola TaxID=1513793 RepID=A0A1Y6CIM1_9BACT|nr:NCS2 family permease [Pseudobacteriovorax antillogorgiicola]TCS46947.1 AGZA family xanthine/uracil permease-like MFS transporter [Pseudobacteriovorax antillogorgiicola]SMF64482.1 putative MFS transporter, AGZA family, xanthine/uracil permease [Pseudobacteriovorax antillogorgiicola]